MDVSPAFLNSELEEGIYMNQPKGYVRAGEEDIFCKLNKSIYGLKQSWRCWFNTMGEFLKNSGYVQSSSDPCLYIKREGEDIIQIGKLPCMLMIWYQQVTARVCYVQKRKLYNNVSKWKTSEKSTTVWEFKWNEIETINKWSYIKVKFGMQDCKPAATPVYQSTKLMPNEGEPAEKDKYRALIGGLT